MRTQDEQTPPADEGPVERTVRPLRLYVVRVVREAYVLAEDEAEAAEMQSEIERLETPEVEIGTGTERLDGWSDEPKKCLVYHSGQGDITLEAARRDFAAA